jgi:ABC-type Na+ efflux pump permease subunit
MRLSKSWVIASKDFKTFRKRKNIVYSTVIVPLLIAFLFPIIITLTGNRNGGNGISAAELTILLPTFTFFYLILAGYLPTAIASYSIVGEKVQKSLEPLLATPTTDDEILLGKGISAFLPTIIAILGSSVIFMTLMDLVTYGKLGYYFFPNLNAIIVLFLLVPLATILSVEWNVLISSKVSDVRVAQQYGVLLILPLAGIYVCGEVNLIDLGDTGNLLIVAGILLLLSILFFYVARSTFRRNEILTNWK